MANASAPPGAEAQLLSATGLLKHFSTHYKELETTYSTLLGVRTFFTEAVYAWMFSENHPERSEITCIHASALLSFLRALLPVAKPACGKLSQLFGQQLCSELGKALLHDLCLQVKFHLTTSPMDDFSEVLHQDFQESVDKVMRSCLEETARTQPMGIHTNLFEGLLESLEREEERYREEAREAVKRAVSSKNVEEAVDRPKVGVFAAFSGDIPPADFFRSKDSSLSTLSPPAGSLLNFMELGRLIFVALDQLDLQLMVASGKSGDQKYEIIELFLFLQLVACQSIGQQLTARTRDRRSHCLSPTFQLTQDEVSGLLSQTSKEASKYYRSVNAATAFQNWASSPSDIALLAEDELNGLHPLTDYLESIVLKMLVHACEHSSDASNLALTAVTKLVDVVVVEKFSKKDSDHYSKNCICSRAVKYMFLILNWNASESPALLLRVSFPTKLEDILRDELVSNSLSDSKMCLVERLLVCYFHCIEYISTLSTHPVDFLGGVRKIFATIERILPQMCRHRTMKLCNSLKVILWNLKLKRKGNGLEAHLNDTVHHGVVHDGYRSAAYNDIGEHICPVASLVILILKVFDNTESVDVKLKCIENLEECSLCCCMNADDLYSVLIKVNKTVALKKAALKFLWKVVLGDLNGLDERLQAQCVECRVVQVTRKSDSLLLNYGALPLPYSSSKVGLREGETLCYQSLKWSKALERLRGDSFLGSWHHHVHVYNMMVSARSEIRTILENVLKDWVSALSKQMYFALKNGRSTKDLDVPVTCTYRSLQYSLLRDLRPGVRVSHSSLWNVFVQLKSREHWHLAESSFSCLCSLYLSSLAQANVSEAADSSDSTEMKKIVAAARKVFEDWIMCAEGEQVPYAMEQHAKLTAVCSSIAEHCKFDLFVKHFLPAMFTGPSTSLPLDVLVLVCQKLVQIDQKRAEGQLEEEEDDEEDDEGDLAFEEVLVHHAQKTASLVQALLVIISSHTGIPDLRSRALHTLRECLLALVKARSHLLNPLLSAVLNVYYTSSPVFMRKTLAGADSSPDCQDWAFVVSRNLFGCTENFSLNMGGKTLLFSNLLEWPDLAQLVLQCLKSLHALCSPSDFESPPEGEDIALEEHLLEDPQGVKFTHEGVLGPCLSLLTQLCAEYPPVGEKIGPYVRTGMLEDFDDIIAKSSRLSCLVLRLWENFALQELNSKGLSVFLKLFMMKDPPVRLLVPILRKLMATSVGAVRSYLQFTDAPPTHQQPLPPLPSLALFSTEGKELRGDYLDPLGFSRQEGPLTNDQKIYNTWRQNTVEKEFDCGVSNGRVACLLPLHKDWKPFVDDTSFAFWCNIDCNRTQRESLQLGETDDTSVHLFSAGVKKLFVSVYAALAADETCCFLKVRVYRDVESAKEITLKASEDLSALLRCSEWHFVALSFTTGVTRKNQTMKIDLTIDGRRTSECLRLPAIGTVKNSLPFVTVGHLNYSTTRLCRPVSVQMTSLTLFKTSDLDPLSVAVLRAQGKNARNFFVPQDITFLEFFSCLMSQQFLMELDSHFKNLAKITDKLQGKVFNHCKPVLHDNLVFRYNCQSPYHFSFYASAKDSNYEECNSYSNSSVLPCLVYGSVLSTTVARPNALKALLDMGGIKHLFMLLGRLAELNDLEYMAVANQDACQSRHSLEDLLDDQQAREQFFRCPCKYVTVKGVPSGSGGCDRQAVGQVQAECLDLLLLSARKSFELQEQFRLLDGNRMVLRLLHSPRMDTRLPVFKVLVDHCFHPSLLHTDSPSLFSDGGDTSGCLKSPDPAVLLTNSQLLETLLQYWHSVELHKIKINEERDSVSPLNEHPQSMAKDCEMGTCHALEVLHRAVSAVLQRDLKFYVYNFSLLVRMEALKLVIDNAQVLTTVGVDSRQCRPPILKGLVTKLLCDFQDNMCDASTVLGIKEKMVKCLVDFLILGLDPYSALRSHSESCVQRLSRYFQPFSNSDEAAQCKIKEFIEIVKREKISEVLRTPVYQRVPTPEGGIPHMEDQAQDVKDKSLPSSSSSSSFELLEADRAEEKEFSSAEQDMALEGPVVQAKLSDYSKLGLVGRAEVVLALEKFLLAQNTSTFFQLVLNHFKPRQLELLAQHKSSAVRLMVLKIICAVFCGPPNTSPKEFEKFPSSKQQKEERDLQFQNSLSVIHHQLSCHRSSPELFAGALDLITRQAHFVSPDATKGMDFLVKTQKVQKIISCNAGPLLALLHKVNDVSPGQTKEALDLLTLAINHSTMHELDLLKIDGLGESLLLLIESLLSQPLLNLCLLQLASELLSNLVRTLLVVDSVAFNEKGLDLVVKNFLLCKHLMSESLEKGLYGKKVLARVLISSVITILAFMKIRITGRNFFNSDDGGGSPSQFEATKFWKLFAGEEYAMDFTPCSEQLESYLRTSACDISSLASLAVKLLNRCQNFLYALEWIGSTDGVKTSMEGLPLFLLDLQLKCLANNNHSSHQIPEEGHFRRLAISYIQYMKLALPELLCCLSLPDSHKTVKVSLLRRLQCQELVEKVSLFCRGQSETLFKVLCWNLEKLSKELEEPGSVSVAAIWSAFRSRECRSETQSWTPIEVPLYFHGYFSSRVESAFKNIREIVEASEMKAREIHDKHSAEIERNLSIFVMDHGRVGRLAMEKASKVKEDFGKLTFEWVKLAQNCSYESSPWQRDSFNWRELRPSENADHTRTVLELQPRTLPSDLYRAKNKKPGINEDPLRIVLSDTSSPAYGEEVVSLPMSDKDGMAISPECCFHAWVVKPLMDYYGNLFVYEQGLYFSGTKTKFTVKKSNDKEPFNLNMKFEWDSIVDIRELKFRLLEIALEIYLRDGQSFMFVFSDTGEKLIALAAIDRKTGLTRPNGEKQLALVTKDWVERKICNFDYLMKLNWFGGRTYNDINQYPVFPLVLNKSSDGETFELENKLFYRDLTCNVAAAATPEEKLRTKFRDSDTRESLRYHYGSLYSNGAIVQNYLVRVPPFTISHIRLQNGRFDLPDRLFHSIVTTLANSGKNGDVKEAIPELYYMPQLFVNGEDFEFGCRDDNSSVSNVKLFSWAGADPRLFVLAHRAALESDWVTQNLPAWIDLIFGAKQKGPKAIEALNVYHPSVYPDSLGNLEVDDIEFTRNYSGAIGEVPRQLFLVPHAKPNVVQSREINPLMAEEPVPSVKGLGWGSFAFFSSEEHHLKSRDEKSESECKVRDAKRLRLQRVEDEVVLVSADAHLVVDKYKGTRQLLKISPQEFLIRGQAMVDYSRVTYTIASIPAHVIITATLCEGCFLWLGTQNGLVLLYKFEFRGVKSGNGAFLNLKSKKDLDYHSFSVTAIAASSDYNIGITGDSTGHICMWDPHKACVLRTVKPLPFGIDEILISPTSGDWVVASSTPDCARIYLFTINSCTEIASEKLIFPAETLAMTSMKEGTGVNVIATASKDEVSLLSAWDLKKLYSGTVHRHVSKMLWNDKGELFVQWEGFQVEKFTKTSVEFPQLKEYIWIHLS